MWYVTSSFAEVPGLIKPAVIKTDDKEIKHKITEPALQAEIRGLIKPLREAILSSEVAAKIAQIGFKDGEHFKKGEKLIQFDCHRQKAELSAAEAETQARRVIFKNNQDLSRLNAVGTLELEVSKAQLDKALAELNVIKARNQECVIKAPWNGRVTEVKAHAHEVIEPGREIMKILDDDSLEVEMIVPSNWLRWLKPGINYPITVDETGNNYEIKIARVGARVDPVSQTVRVFASFKEETADVLAGMSGSVIFDLPD
jgi:RND family efflux transporter MFP subunit